MLDALTKGQGQVLEGDGTEGKFRQLEEGIEMDIDFDNTEALSAFLKAQNNG
jgi:hypothetical protein